MLQHAKKKSAEELDEPKKINPAPVEEDVEEEYDLEEYNNDNDDEDYDG